MWGRVGEKVLGLFEEQCYLVELCSEVIRLEGLQYGGRLVVRG